MISAIRIHTTIESEILRIPELASLVGRRVEVIVVEENASDGAEAGAKIVDTKKRILGSLQGLLHVPDDFDDPLPEEILRAFGGDE